MARQHKVRLQGEGADGEVVQLVQVPPSSGELQTYKWRSSTL
jgi:hypothetical protein